MGSGAETGRRFVGEVVMGSGRSGIRDFKDLRVWQQAMALAIEIYAVTDALPQSERFALQGQLRRAAVSIPANIAEGHARTHTKEFVRHLSFARGSLAELQTLVFLLERVYGLPSDGGGRLHEKIREVRCLLLALMRCLREKLSHCPRVL